MMPCPTCGSPHCIQPAEAVLSQSMSLYSPCSACANDLPINKFTPLVELFEAVDRDQGRCPVCGKRHLDYAMAQVLDLLIKNGLKDAGSALKDVGTPLIEYGFSLVEPPRLPDRSVVLVIDHIDAALAAKIYAEVPEIKGILSRSCDPKASVGIRDVADTPRTYSLVAGCDIRADIVNSLVGDLCLYRNQGECHIEFWRSNSVKVKTIEKLYLDGLIDGATVVDGMASVGTLGLLAALGGAKKVILNDAWLPAVRNLLINLEVNQKALGISINPLENIEGLPQAGDRPTLVVKANGSVEIEAYHGDLRKLNSVVSGCDLCIVDPFPGVDPEPFADQWQKIAKKVIVL